ncbi:hypothetical protein N7G274_004295 [Stereocaulon virgatum]|uniref:A to I editase domain-containing protein n=1 Tax=Stereocaulon virgatum TaxID=373712 RepID=A0ABR4ABT5_9LECA
MESLEDRVARSVFEIFDTLPAKCKPRTYETGVREWVPLSGIAVVGEDGIVTCVALGTGMKCLPASLSSISSTGGILHDWHAEVLAIRSFNHFLLDEALSIARDHSFQSSILRQRVSDELSSQEAGRQPYTIREGLKILMYCSEAPCGDASMELVMEAQKDDTPWPVNLSGKNAQQGLLGRGSFSQLGIVRRKPSRGDAPPTLSKSCSDKLALKQCTSLLLSTTSLAISPENAYINTLIIPKSQYRPEACERSFGPEGRMKPMVGKAWSQGYAFRPFQVKTTDLEFTYSRRSTASNPNGKSKGCNISAVWNPRYQDTLINGARQGFQLGNMKSASKVSAHKMWMDFMSINKELGGIRPADIIQRGHTRDYTGYTIGFRVPTREQVKKDTKKEALKGWDRGADKKIAGHSS